MLSQKDMRLIRKFMAKRDKARKKVELTDEALISILKEIKFKNDASYEELARVLGVSRQRVHQILKGE